jgi:hypothetical protein
MGLIDLFNQWITEHGSATVQEKHLSLFRDQLIASDKKSAVLESENTILKTENAELKAKVDQLTKDNEKLRGKIQEGNQMPTQFERKTANNGVVYLRHESESNVFACANCSSHDRLLYLLPDPYPSSGDVVVYFCDKCRKSITLNKIS